MRGEYLSKNLKSEKNMKTCLFFYWRNTGIFYFKRKIKKNVLSIRKLTALRLAGNEFLFIFLQYLSF